MALTSWRLLKIGGNPTKPSLLVIYYFSLWKEVYFQELLCSMFPALTTNIRLGCDYLERSNTLAYYPKVRISPKDLYRTDFWTFVPFEWVENWKIKLKVIKLLYSKMFFTPMIEFLVHRYLWFSQIDFQYTHKRER